MVTQIYLATEMESFNYPRYQRAIPLQICPRLPYFVVAF